MNNHVESGVGSNLKSRLSSDLQANMESHQQEMIERMTALLPVERQQMSRNILPRREAFEVILIWNINRSSVYSMSLQSSLQLTLSNP